MMPIDQYSPLSPPPRVLCKLGSIIVHVDEAMSDSGHAFDKIAFEALMSDPDVVRWMAEMRAMALLPEKR